MRRPLLLLIAATAVVASALLLAADPKPSSRVSTQTADPQTAAAQPASGVEDTPSDSSDVVAQTSVAVSSDPSASTKSASSTTTSTTATTTTTTTLMPEPTPTSSDPAPLAVELVADTRTDANTKTAPTTTAAITEGGQVYVWYDGDRMLRVRLQSDLTVQTGFDGQGDAIVARSAVTTQANGQALPVFRSESSGNLMTLPGGVLVVFDSDLDDAQISKFLTAQGISKDRVSTMLLHNAFEIETEPAFPALELANRLATLGESLVAIPNWAFDAVTK